MKTKLKKGDLVGWRREYVGWTKTKPPPYDKKAGFGVVIRAYRVSWSEAFSEHMTYVVHWQIVDFASRFRKTEKRRHEQHCAYDRLVKVDRAKFFKVDRNGFLEECE